MSKRDNIKTTKKQIVQYWRKVVDESLLSVDVIEMGERCWRCGCKRNLERCHIVPDSLGGEDTPSNFVLLCKRCHLDNPNVADKEIMWDWLKAIKRAVFKSNVSFWRSAFKCCYARRYFPYGFKRI